MVKFFGVWSGVSIFAPKKMLGWVLWLALNYAVCICSPIAVPRKGDRLADFVDWLQWRSRMRCWSS